jgi:hypothetical protein
VFIRNIARILEGLIYILLGVAAATIIVIPFALPTDDFAELIEEVTEVLIFTIFILQPVPTILRKHINRSNNDNLIRLVYVLKNIHIALGILFIGLRILHMETNILFESLKWDIEIITSTLLSILLIPTIIYAQKPCPDDDGTGHARSQHLTQRHLLYRYLEQFRRSRIHIAF